MDGRVSDEMQKPILAVEPNSRLSTIPAPRPRVLISGRGFVGLIRAAMAAKVRSPR